MKIFHNLWKILVERISHKLWKNCGHKARDPFRGWGEGLLAALAILCWGALPKSANQPEGLSFFLCGDGPASELATHPRKKSRL